MNSSPLSETSYLGIDWGEKKVGMAIADMETRMVFPVATLANDANLLKNISKLIVERNVRAVVIGIPSHVNRETVEYGGETLGGKIEDALHVPVFYENEMFTTKLARQRLIERGVKRNLDAKDDMEAARIILEEWLLARKDATLESKFHL